MSKYYALYNPLSGSKLGKSKAQELAKLYPNDTVIFVDMLSIDSYNDFFNCLDSDDRVVVCGGDGTLNRFINSIEGINIINDILYFATGSGNDFLRDMEKSEGELPFSIKEQIKNLPIATVNGKAYRFINGIGYGIDGYCCQVGDSIRSKDSAKKINYTSIAIKGLLFHYKPRNATVTIDNKSYYFKKVWICPTMIGRYYGGGMLPAPTQSRNDKDKHLTVLLMHGSGRLKTLMMFPSIFKGTHVRHTSNCTTISGKRITVEFDKPTPLQIDGETILDVTKYEASLAPCYINKSEMAVKDFKKDGNLCG